MASTYDTIVVGGGVEGSAAAYHLTRRGYKTLLLEQFYLPHTRGSSHGQSRIIRKAYPQQYYTRMMGDAYRQWHLLEGESGTTLYKKTGLLVIERTNSRSLTEVAASLRSSGADFKTLDTAACRRQYSMINFDNDQSAVLDPEAGILLADKAVAALQSSFVRHGGYVLDGKRVTSIIPGKVVKVVTAHDTYHASSVIITAGAWTNRLTEPLGLHLPLQPVAVKAMYWKQKVPNSYSMSAGYPTLISSDSMQQSSPHVYSLPAEEYPDHVKVCSHAGTSVDPDARDGGVYTADVEHVQRFVQKYLPGLEPRPSIVEKCIYTLTPDENFILDTHPRWKNIVIGAGFSGHGFKLAPVVGSILASLAAGSTPEHPIHYFSAQRFQSKAKL